MSDDIKNLDVRFSKCIITEVRSSKSIIIEDIEDIFAAAATIEALRAERDRLKAAMVEVEDRLNCRGNPDIAHYCPNCDNSLYKTREIAREALEAKE